MKKLFAIILLSCMSLAVNAGLTQSELDKAVMDSYSRPLITTTGLPVACEGRNSRDYPWCQELKKQLASKQEASK